ncbi:MHYT domain-containing protein [Mesorhizobium sp. M0571]|uniref:MHYT domain-containing protein n=1 Tax=Mesorhizobium sp. M0571 TaxID=2956960 RepID=UPI003334FE0D
MIVTGTHNPYLVAFSILVAVFASYTALDLGGHVVATRGLARHLWLVAAAITMGGGIWSMHFVAMLAFIMPSPMSYDIGLTTLSLAVAICVTGGGFYVISRRRASPFRLMLSGICMGLGIAAMHYVGMAAMRGPAQLSYDRLFVALSLAIAIGAATVSLWLAFRTTAPEQKLVAAIVMGLAISGMHYTAMEAAIFTAHGSVHDAQGNANLDQTNLALAVASVTFVVLACALIASLSEQKRAEEALRQTQANLVHVARVTTLGELTASIAHEVNQPLAAIVTNGEVCLQWLDREVPDLTEVREALDAMINNGRRASEIIQRLRALSRKTETQKAALNINDAISEVIPLVQHEVLKHQVSLRLELAPTLPAVLGDRVQLQQVIINLLVNGVDAMASVDSRPRELAIRSQRHGPGQVLIAIRDTGVGIDPQSVRGIFEAFYSTKPSGMGMGLSICRSIVESHGGTIWASPNEGPGATFQFALPSRLEQAA